MSLDASTMPVKYQKAKSTHRSGITIYEVPASGLYRVIEIDRGNFTVETLTQVGWTTLIVLDDRDGIPTATEAMQVWLDIQTPAEPKSEEEQPQPPDGT